MRPAKFIFLGGGGGGDVVKGEKKKKNWIRTSKKIFSEIGTLTTLYTFSFT